MAGLGYAGGVMWFGAFSSRACVLLMGAVPLLGVFVGCGGTVETLPPDGSGGSASGGAPSGGSGGSAVGGAPAGGTTGVGGAPGTGGSPSSGGTGGFADPGCPDVPQPDPYYECDPLDPEVGCGEGYACYPYVSHPYGTGCGTQQFGAVCAPVGTGTHGDFCGDGYGRCAAGFLCVVGASAGKRCAKLCPLDGPHDCPAGLICGETDVAGYGVCY